METVGTAIKGTFTLYSELYNILKHRFFPNFSNFQIWFSFSCCFLRTILFLLLLLHVCCTQQQSNNWSCFCRNSQYPCWVLCLHFCRTACALYSSSLLQWHLSRCFFFFYSIYFIQLKALRTANGRNSKSISEAVSWY